MRRRNIVLGFTLIELLLVIAIVCMFAAILFPVFAAAREKARQTTCSSNLKQIGMALQEYMQDNDFVYPNGYVVYDHTSASCVPIKNWYVLQVGFDGLTNGLSTTWMDYLLPYTQSTSVYFCPDGPPDENTMWRQSGPAANNPSFSYGYAMNTWILTPLVFNPGTPCTIRIDWWSPAITESKMINPTADVVLTDRGQIDVEHLQPFATSQGYAEQDPTTSRGIANGTNPSWRHNGRSNFLFLDGHVKSYPWTQMNPTTYLQFLGCQPIQSPATCL